VRLLADPMPTRSPEQLADDYPMNAIARAFMRIRKHLDVHGLDHDLARKVVLEWLCEGFDDEIIVVVIDGKYRRELSLARSCWWLA
jgi:hypothetical protein